MFRILVSIPGGKIRNTLGLKVGEIVAENTELLVLIGI